MNKTQMIDAIATKTGMKKKDAETAFCATIDIIVETLVKGEKVQLSGLGSFEVKTRTARVGRNPKTQEMIEIAECKYPSFSAGKALKDAVNK